MEGPLYLLGKNFKSLFLQRISDSVGQRLVDSYPSSIVSERSRYTTTYLICQWKMSPVNSFVYVLTFGSVIYLSQ